MRLIFLMMSVAACGGKIIGGGVDAATETSDVVPCADAGDCPATTEFCHIVSGGPPPGIFTHDCKALPPNCHSCDCANPPTQNGEQCVCTSDGDQIIVSCNVP